MGGWFKAQYGNGMGMFINMWHAQEMEEHAGLAGQYWDECRGKAVLHAGAVVGYAALDYIQFTGLAKLGRISSLDPVRLNGALSPGSRIEAQTLAEEMTMQRAREGAGRRIMEGAIKDARFPGDVFAKMQVVAERAGGQNAAATVHYWQNLYTGARFGFKFK